MDRIEAEGSGGGNEATTDIVGAGPVPGPRSVPALGLIGEVRACPPTYRYRPYQTIVFPANAGIHNRHPHTKTITGAHRGAPLRIINHGIYIIVDSRLCRNDGIPRFHLRSGV